MIPHSGVPSHDGRVCGKYTEGGRHRQGRGVFFNRNCKSSSGSTGNALIGIIQTIINPSCYRTPTGAPSLRDELDELCGEIQSIILPKKAFIIIAVIECHDLNSISNDLPVGLSIFLVRQRDRGSSIDSAPFMEEAATPGSKMKKFVPASDPTDRQFINNKHK